MDFATLLGLVSAMGVMGTAMFLGGNLGGFIDVPSILIVVAGTAAVTLVSFTFQDIGSAFQAIGSTFSLQPSNLALSAEKLVRLCIRARKEGVVALQTEALREPDHFLRQGLILAVDSNAPDLIERILHADTAVLLEHQTAALAVLRRAADIAPAMGLIGTLIGLVQMLTRLSDPAAIGPAMAIAILTTFYGSVLAYMVFTPLAGKIEHNSALMLSRRKIQLAGILSISRLENPRNLELTLNSLLPPAQRIRVFK
jgi:chemotaxis protein MotA